MPDFLRAVGERLVVVGSVARTIRDPHSRTPKDIDLLCDVDSPRGRKEIDAAVKRFGLDFESPFVACWTFRRYGWMTEIICLHHGPAYRDVRRRATPMTIGGVELLVARAEDAPKTAT